MDNTEKLRKLRITLNSPSTPEAYKPRIRSAIDALEKEPKAKSVSTYKATSVKTARKVTKNLKKYYLHRDIKTVTVLEDGKKVTYKGSDVLNGANFLAKGGILSNIATYFPVRNIVEVELEDGSKVKPSNGYHIKETSIPIAASGTELDSGFTPTDFIVIEAESRRYSGIIRFLVKKSELEKIPFEYPTESWTMLEKAEKFTEVLNDESGEQTYVYKKHITNPEKVKAFMSGFKHTNYEIVPNPEWDPQDDNPEPTPEEFHGFSVIKSGYNDLSAHNNDFNLEEFLEVMQPKLATVFKKHGLTLSPQYKITKDGTVYTGTVLFSKEDDKPKTVVIGYWDKNDITMNSVGEIEFELQEKEFHVRFPHFKINSVEMYAKGGWTNDHNQLNQREDYEVRYNKKNPRKLEKGGDTNKEIQSEIDKAVVEKNFNKAVKIIQDAIGQTDGGLAGIFFSDYDQDGNGNIKAWKDVKNRREIIENYIEFEKSFEEEELEKGGKINQIGRLAKGKTLQQIADMHGVSLDYIKNQMDRGAKVEMEHTTENNIARAITKDHLFENPDYYIMLSKMEKSAEVPKRKYVKNKPENHPKIKNPNKKGNPVFDLARKIRQPGQNWQEAIQDAKKELKKQK